MSAEVFNLEVIDNNGDPIYLTVELNEIPSSPLDAAGNSWPGWVGSDYVGAAYPDGASPNSSFSQQVMYTASTLFGGPYILSTVMNQSWSMVNGVVTTASMLPGVYVQSVWEGMDP